MDSTTFPITRNERGTSDEQLAEYLSDPGFGRYFTDHMVLIDWDVEQGWHDPRIVPTAPLQMHPSAAVLHYGQEIFEGLKAYRRADGSVWLFRPEMNARRFATSARRLDMPELPEQLFLDSVRQLVDLDRRWVPEGVKEQNLYIRPFQIATEQLIGVRAALKYTYCVLASPAGPYYADPMKLWVTPNFTRAAWGGTGEAKCGGNYASSLAAADEAAEHGCGQVLWLDGGQRRFVEECGTMNVMFVTADDELITPALSGSILAGVTRNSLLQLASDNGLRPVERQIDIDELRKGLAEGWITESFGCGTAAVISPVIGFKAPEWELPVGDGQVGPHSRELRRTLLGIQYGDLPDERGWTEQV